MSGLLGPNGDPIQDYMEHAASRGRPKVVKPIVGDAFANWSGTNSDLMSLPGGGLIGFDTSRLTLADFRKMREHYQIGSSLHILTFMLHQLDWHIECEDKAVEEWCTINLEDIWTRLVRAMSSAFWAGYSANACEWENDSSFNKLRLNKVKDLVPEECEVNWKFVDAATREPNTIAPKVPIFDGIKKRGTLHKIDVENSFWYPLLMENGDYKGKRLLKTAFQPWFFSSIIHLYQNKYFERFGEPVPIGRAPYNDKIKVGDKTMQGHELMAQVISMIRSRSAVVLPNDRSKEGLNDTPEFDYQVEYLECVDTDTEILTRHGWKKYNEVSVGDEVMTLDNELGVSEWQPVQAMNVHEAKDRKMLSMEGNSHSSLTTENHRWPTRYTCAQVKDGNRYESDYRRFRYSSNLTQSDRIPLCATPSDLPTDPKYVDAFVKLVAWFWTEGWVDKNTENFGTISQKRFPEKVRAVLKSLYGDPVDSFPRNVWNAPSPTTPMWREGGKTDDEDNRIFFLNYAIMQELKSVMSVQKVVTYEFINSLTESQLGMYLKTAVDADGNNTKRQVFLMQKSRAMAEMFQYACTLYGFATNLYHMKPDVRFPNDTGMWTVSIRRSQYMNPRVAAKSKTGKFKMEWVDYSGIVWCPTTSNSTWLARRNGTVYFTGNSQMRGADFERYLTRLDEEMSLALFTPLLLLRTADSGGFNQGVAHTQVYLWMLNAIAGDFKEYIDKYIIRPMALYNFGSKARMPRIKFRKLGTAQQETLRAIVQTLIQKGSVKPNTEELGAHIGLDLEEVEQLVEDDKTDSPDGPFGDTRDRSEKLKEGDGIKPASTTKAIQQRIKDQVNRVYKRGESIADYHPTLGYRKQLVAELEANGCAHPSAAANAFEHRATGAILDVAALGNSYSPDAEAFMSHVEGILRIETERIYDAN